MQTSCIFVPAIPDMLLPPQKVMYIWELMKLSKGDFPLTPIEYMLQAYLQHGKLIFFLIMDTAEPWEVGAALKA